MDFLKTISVAASGLKVQSGRMRVIAENIANADSTAEKPGADPYRRKIPTFKAVYDADVGGETVQIGQIAYDMSDFDTRYEPGHPAADEKGYVKYPNIDPLIESMDMREAQRTYEANMNVISTSRQMVAKTLELLK